MSLHFGFPYKLYLVISEVDCKGRDFLKVAENAILGGVDIIQLREKNCTTQTFLEKAKRLKEITDKHNVPLIINDNIEVAIQTHAAGIHVGNNDIPPTAIRTQTSSQDKLIGYSIEYLSQLENEKTAVSDYLAISPVFSTKTKTNTITEWGLEGISTIRQLTEKPLVAIGNINIKNVKAVLNAGADCIAVVSAICDADDPQQAAYQLKNEILK